MTVHRVRDEELELQNLASGDLIAACGTEIIDGLVSVELSFQLAIPIVRIHAKLELSAFPTF